MREREREERKWEEEEEEEGVIAMSPVYCQEA